MLEILLNLDVTKAMGPDGLPASLYKQCASVLYPSITTLFNLCLNVGDIPRDWKVAHIVPVYKKGLRNNVSNYRPVSLLNIIGKVLEKCIFQYVFSSA